jgi:hypothetical protein
MVVQEQPYVLIMVLVVAVELAAGGMQCTPAVLRWRRFRVSTISDLQVQQLSAGGGGGGGGMTQHGAGGAGGGGGGAQGSPGTCNIRNSKHRWWWRWRWN